MDDSQPIDLEGLNESELLALQEQAQKELDAQGQEVGEDQDQDDEDVIDVDNPEDLAKKGLRRIQIEGDEQEYLLDNDGNIYNLQGEFVGTTDGDVEEEEGEPAQKDKWNVWTLIYYELHRRYAKQFKSDIWFGAILD